MTDTNTDNNKDGTHGGLSVNKDGINCLFCTCKRNTYHKETKTTTTEDNKVIVNVVENRSSFKKGKGRNVSPDDGIFKPDATQQVGGVALCSTGWSHNRKITPEECEERLDKIEEDVERIDKDVAHLKQNNMNLMD